MKDETKRGEEQRKKEAPGRKRPSSEREDPLARDARGAARRDEIRARAPKLVAPRQSRRPMERSRQKRAHKR